MGMYEPWVCSVRCWRRKVSYPDLYFSLVMTDNSSTTREASLFWETPFMLHGTWKSTNFVSVFDNILKIALCLLGEFLKTRAKCVLGVNLLYATSLPCRSKCLHGIGGCGCAQGSIAARAASLSWSGGRRGLLQNLLIALSEQNRTSLTAQTSCLHPAVSSHSLCLITDTNSCV